MNNDKQKQCLLGILERRVEEAVPGVIAGVTNTDYAGTLKAKRRILGGWVEISLNFGVISPEIGQMLEDQMVEIFNKVKSI